MVYDQEPELSFASVEQVHGDVVVDTARAGAQADGLIKKLGNPTALAIKTADCLPIAVVGHQGQALLHAGWRGVQLEIYQVSTVKELEPYYFFIGPSIQQKSFIVTEEFHDHFPQSPHHFHDNTFSLQGYVKESLAKIYPDAQVEDCSIDTFSDQRFHSYRRDKTTLRNWNLLVDTVSD